MLMSWNEIFTVKSLRVCTKKAEWINDEYLELRRKSMRAKHLANIAKHDERYGTAKVLRNRLNNMGVKLKKQYFNKILYDNKGNTKTLWTTLKSLLPSKKSTHTLIPETNKRITMLQIILQNFKFCQNWIRTVFNYFKFWRSIEAS